ncbi:MULTISPECIES: hypothetical protein [Microcoleaceae]|nr:hypothetical protein [Tychonema sp. LEGE 06208]MBE9163918.1 hypothetical protein [Tychonema sp. LEGE 06208]
MGITAVSQIYDGFMTVDTSIASPSSADSRQPSARDRITVWARSISHKLI